MKFAALDKFREKLKRNEPAYGLWVTLESASITEMAVTLGLDWVVIDAEHGHLDLHDVQEHLRATVRSDTIALVRVAELNIGLIKRALDIGADGVVIPWVETVEQLTDAVSFSRYPPEGKRGIGGERATGWGQGIAEYVAQANDKILVVPIIESVRGADNIQDLVKVPGVETFFFGPADFSSSAGHAGQWEGPGVAEQIQAANNVIRAAGKHSGVIATSAENLEARRKQGFRMLGLGSDSSFLLNGMRQMKEVAEQAS
ncbi:MAG: aldolase/citrate lyase family protein [Planctomycetota bacterium]|nr:aldolase/citrate lyase family protein [Planctomycetota bacterium]MDA1140297.1 aldolase/citrate lyase family protein [Planctomycetota bacterium]